MRQAAVDALQCHFTFETQPQTTSPHWRDCTCRHSTKRIAAAEAVADSARSRRKPLEQAAVVARKTRRRPAAGRAGPDGRPNCGAPPSPGDKTSRGFSARRRRGFKRKWRGERHPFLKKPPWGIGAWTV